MSNEYIFLGLLVVVFGGVGSGFEISSRIQWPVSLLERDRWRVSVDFGFLS